MVGYTQANEEFHSSALLTQHYLLAHPVHVGLAAVLWLLYHMQALFKNTHTHTCFHINGAKGRRVAMPLPQLLPPDNGFVSQHR